MNILAHSFTRTPSSGSARLVIALVSVHPNLKKYGHNISCLSGAYSSAEREICPVHCDYLQVPAVIDNFSFILQSFLESTKLAFLLLSLFVSTVF